MAIERQPQLDRGSSIARAVLTAIALALVLYVFFVGLDLMGIAFKGFGKGFAETLISSTANPFVGLFIGILATSLVQSSSTTTSMTVAIVAAGGLTVEGAIPIVMGANIGTSVTNTIVSLGHITRPEEFRRAFAGATLHDFFNWLAVLVLLPLEITTGYLAKSSTYLQELVVGVGGGQLLNPLKTIVRPAAELVERTLLESPGLVLVAGLLCLFFALRYLVKILRTVASGPAERVLHGTVFRYPAVALLAGIVVTVMVQSSSITTSVVVPLVGAGVVTLEQLFPLTVGANIGTTVTAIVAALATGNPAAITIAMAHLLFNVSATLLIYVLPPVRRIPLALARMLGDLAVRSRLAAIAYIVGAFFVLPLLFLFLTRGFGQ